MLTPMERALRAKSEKDWQQEVLDVLHLHGWTVYHTFDSRRSVAGFPDLLAIRVRGVDNADIFVAELKRETENPTVEQHQWLLRFIACDVDAYVWRPRDMDEVVARAQGLYQNPTGGTDNAEGS